jgi:hypothetical protein
MEPSWTHQPQITLSQPFGPGARAVFALAGFAAFVWALRQVSPPLPAMAVSVSFISLSLTILLLNAFGRSEEWTLSEKELTLARRLPWRLSTVRFKGRDIAATAIAERPERDADGRAVETFSLVILSKRGRSYQLPPLDSWLKAEALEAELRARLGLPPQPLTAR